MLKWHNFPATTEAVAHVARHFVHLNRGDEEAAKDDLFHPVAMPRRPLDLYVKRMIMLGPFKLLRTSVLSVEHPQPQGVHGVFGAVLVEIDVQYGERDVQTKRMPVWSSEAGELKIATRFSGWTLALVDEVQEDDGSPES